MTPAALLRELALIAVVTTVWVALVLLMLERDRKRMERRARYAGMTDEHQGAESSEARPSSFTSNERADAVTPAQEDTREIQPR